MSAGKFDRDGRYQSDANRVYRCSHQPETTGIVLGARGNDHALGQVTPGLGSLTLRVSKRSLGVIPRTVLIRLTGPATGLRGDYQGAGTLHRVVVFRKGRYDFYQPGMTGFYAGIACVIVNKQPEVLR